MIKIEVSPREAARVPEGFALWNLGFRPFYFVASLFASLSILLWIFQYSGHVPAEFLRSPAWHGHEMLFGYTMAVVAGFLLTAVTNWTGRPTPNHGALMGLTALWVAGRVLVLTPFTLAAAIVNVAFPVALAFGIGGAIVRSRNRRNYFFLALLALLSIAVLAFHLSHLDVLPWPERASLQVGLDVILFIMAVIGGRVIPMFTNNGVPGAQATRNPVVERAALIGALVLIGIDLFPAPGWLVAVVAFMAALAHAIRLYLWRPHRTRSVPLVWVLHIAYAWIVVYLVLRGLSELGFVEQVFAVHALTIGAIGGMTIGMMSRTARGHTGRPLRADRYDVACFTLIAIAAFVRVFGGLWLPSAYALTVMLSGACWSAAFALFAIRYWPVLSRVRVDGKPG
jgi:uncharacterized protein involved in response to NO